MSKWAEGIVCIPCHIWCAFLAFEHFWSLLLHLQSNWQILYNGKVQYDICQEWNGGLGMKLEVSRVFKMVKGVEGN